MEPGDSSDRKPILEKTRQQPGQRRTCRDQDEHRALVSLRSAFILTVALLVALAAGGLLYAAHRSIALAVLGAGGAFAAAVTFFNVLIELWLAVATRCAGSRC